MTEKNDIDSASSRKSLRAKQEGEAAPRRTGPRGPNCASDRPCHGEQVVDARRVGARDARVGSATVLAGAVSDAVRRYYRVEGLGRRGVVRFAKVWGVPGLWRVSGPSGLRIEVAGRTVQEALRLARRQIPFRVLVVHEVATLEELHGRSF